jgi:hypothetical protein
MPLLNYTASIWSDYIALPETQFLIHWWWALLPSFAVVAGLTAWKATRS